MCSERRMERMNKIDYDAASLDGAESNLSRLPLKSRIGSVCCACFEDMLRSNGGTIAQQKAEMTIYTAYVQQLFPIPRKSIDAMSQVCEQIEHGFGGNKGICTPAQ